MVIFNNVGLRIKMDNLTKEQRRKNMQAIRSKDTKPEIILRKALWKKGFRYRKNYKFVPGTPDIVFMKKKIAIFCDGEFFHGYKWEENKKRIKSNKIYWINKIENNIIKDKKNNRLLRKNGWSVLRIWNKEILFNLEICLNKIKRKNEIRI
jgi:DNA mismatch endonuclease, patch repair protein